jgi:hypothetical protein
LDRWVFPDSDGKGFDYQREQQRADGAALADSAGQKVRFAYFPVDNHLGSGIEVK